jgi:peptidyl-prolyl cis-trans isomerase A (cyclophilin A)
MSASSAINPPVHHAARPASSRPRPASQPPVDSLEPRQLLTATPEVTSITADNRGYAIIRLNAQLDPTTVTRKTVVIYVAGKNGVLGSSEDTEVLTHVSYSTSADAIKISGDVSANESYIVDVTNHVKGTNGQAIHNSISHSGNIAYEAEVTPVAADTDPVAIITTNYGTMSVLLYETKVAETVNNFIKYANDGLYDTTIVHRLLPTSALSTNGIAVIQAGGYVAEQDAQTGLPTAIPTFAPIHLQAGISNTQGTIAMARTSSPNSASSQFFFNTVDNTALDTEGGGYAVFGKVTNANSQTVLNTIDAIPPENLTPSQQSDFNDVPIQSGNFVIFSRIAIEANATPI